MKELFPQHLHRLNAFLNSLPYELVQGPTEEEEGLNQDLVRDPKDVPIALAAIKARVDYLVSTDKDLTDLDKSTEKLRSLIRPIKPWAFLEEVMGWDKEELEKISKRHWKEIEGKTGYAEGAEKKQVTQG